MVRRCHNCPEQIPEPSLDKMARDLYLEQVEKVREVEVGTNKMKVAVKNLVLTESSTGRTMRVAMWRNMANFSLFEEDDVLIWQ
jgi:hypothetical protein